MTHEEALNRLLSLQCPSNIADLESGLLEFEFELHCTAVKITAKKVGQYDNELELQRFQIVDLRQIPSLKAGSVSDLNQPIFDFAR